MNKSDLITKIVKLNSGVYQKDASKIVNIFFNTISNAILKNDRVELRGFGVFGSKERDARIARNPKNGSVEDIHKKKIPYFRMGKNMKDRLNK